MKKPAFNLIPLLFAIFLVLLAACNGNTDASENGMDGHGNAAMGTWKPSTAGVEPVARESSRAQSPVSSGEGIPAAKEPAGIRSESMADGMSAKLGSMEKAFMESDFFLKENLIPLAVTKDQKYFVAYKIVKGSTDNENENILVGMPRRTVELYRVDPAGKKAVPAGKSEFIVSHAWSGDGKRLSLVSRGSVKVLDMTSGKLSEVPLKYEKDGIYNTNWDPDNRTLNIHLDTVANYYSYDVLSGKMKKTRGGFAEGDVVYRGMAGEKPIFSKGKQVGVASGLYLGSMPGKLLTSEDAVIHDTDQDRILISYRTSGENAGYVLEEYDTTKGENRILYYGDGMQGQWKIFKASYLKTTGEILYTTFQTDEHGVNYLLVRIGRDGRKTAMKVPSPLYSVTPGEGYLDFAAFQDGEAGLMKTSDFQFLVPVREVEYKNSEIRELMYRALDVYSSESPDPAKIRRVFINSYDTVPQEALENILLELDKAGYWNYTRLEIGKDIAMTVKQARNGDNASVTLNGLYFRGPHELVKKEGKWYITGFSTWPGSKTRSDVYKACIRSIDQKTGSEKIMDKIGASFSKIEVGEIEIWAMSEPHRAIYPNAYANEARVKIIVTRKNGLKEKFLAGFSKRNTGGVWKCVSFGNCRRICSPGSRRKFVSRNETDGYRIRRQLTDMV